MTRFEGRDPLAMGLYRDPSSLRRGWVCAFLTRNLLKAPLSPEAKEIEVRVTDRFGRIYTERIRRD